MKRQAIQQQLAEFTWGTGWGNRCALCFSTRRRTDLNEVFCTQQCLSWIEYMIICSSLAVNPDSSSWNSICLDHYGTSSAKNATSALWIHWWPEWYKLPEYILIKAHKESLIAAKSSIYSTLQYKSFEQFCYGSKHQWRLLYMRGTYQVWSQQRVTT